MENILYSFRRCPYAMRARMALRYAKVDYQHREVKLANKPQAMLTISPKGTVPVLQLNTGEVIDESLDIMYWALSQNNPDQWLMTDDNKLIVQNDCEFKKWLDRYKYPNRYPNTNQMASREKAENYIKRLEQQLSSSLYLYGNGISLADIAIFPFVRQFSKVDSEWFYQSDYLQVRRWLQGHETSGLFLSIMQKKAIWQNNEDNP